MNIKIVELKGKSKKSRSGTFISIVEKGKRKYYPYKIGENIDSIIEYHKDKTKKKTKGTLKKYKSAYKEVLYSKNRGKSTPIRKKAQRYKRKFSEILQKGIGNTRIEEIRTITDGELQRKKEEMLKNIVLDQEIRRLVAKEENLKKLKNRLQTLVEVRGENGEVLDKINIFSKTPTEIRSMFKNDFQNDMIVTKTSVMPYAQAIANNNLKSHIEIDKRKLKRISTTIVFRKG